MSEIVRKRLSQECIGCELAKDIMKDKNIKLISKDTLLTSSIIDNLERHGVKNIYVIERK